MLHPVLPTPRDASPVCVHIPQLSSPASSRLIQVLPLPRGLGLPSLLFTIAEEKSDSQDEGRVWVGSHRDEVLLQFLGIRDLYLVFAFT
jgi:hypothetical protein